MNFKEVKRVEYQHNILFEVLFQARFPEIMKISLELPAEFQDIVRKEGYPELEDIPVLPPGMPKEFEEAFSTAKEFHFLSEGKDWRISLAKNFVAFTWNGNYTNYEDFRERTEKVLQIFHKVYEPSYFTRIGLRHKNVANRVTLPHTKYLVKDFIPEHIFPELATSIAMDIETLEKVSLFKDGNIKARVHHILSEISGRFKRKRITNEKSYIIDVDCFCESRVEGIKNVLTKCDTFKRLSWNIFEWSITDTLREAMGTSRS